MMMRSRRIIINKTIEGGLSFRDGPRLFSTNTKLPFSASPPLPFSHFQSQNPTLQNPNFFSYHLSRWVGAPSLKPTSIFPFSSSVSFRYVNTHSSEIVPTETQGTQLSLYALLLIQLFNVCVLA